MRLEKLAEWISDLFSWIRGNFREKHIWLENIELAHEYEVHTNNMDPFEKEHVENICKLLNLIPNNPFEGEGWWERVKITKSTGFFADEIGKLVELIGGMKCILIPQQVLEDIRKTKDHVIGFREPNLLVTRSVVWIHY